MRRENGKTRRRRGSLAGGFYPSVMSGLVGAGSLFTLASLRQGYRLLENDKERMRGRLQTRRGHRRAAKPGSKRYKPKRS